MLYRVEFLKTRFQIEKTVLGCWEHFQVLKICVKLNENIVQVLLDIHCKLIPIKFTFLQM